jgi:hypothetical protein
LARPSATGAEAGGLPIHRWQIAGVSTVVGLLFVAFWSASFVDTTIGANVASTVVGHDAKAVGIGGTAAGLLFALAAGLGGTFTACNVAAFGALAPMVADGAGAGSRVKAALRPLGWVAVGMVPVAVAYGAIGAMLGEHLPALSTAKFSDGTPVRLVQSVVVFAVIGLVFIWMGLAALKLVPDPFRRLTERWPQTPLVVVGVLIGAFLVGRPYPLFRKMFEYAAANGNPFYGALTFLLVALGNIALMAVLFVALALVAGSRLGRWITAKPGRAAAITGAALIVAGVFTFAYWGLRVPSRYGHTWFPYYHWT